jgi:hypothetical protein
MKTEDHGKEKSATGEPQVGHKPFSVLKYSDNGFVIMGAGEPHQEWVDGISKMLVEEGIAKAPVFSDAFIVDGNVAGANGRTDLALLFSGESKPDVDTLAMWRIRFGNTSWIDTFIQEYGKDYGGPARGSPRAGAGCS